MSDRPEAGGGAGPAFSFEGARVRDAMRSPIRSCTPDLPLRAVAELMASQRIHALVVAEPGAGGAEDRVRGVISGLDLVSAAAEGFGSRTAGDIATKGMIAVGADEPLIAAARLMRDEGANHLVAVEAGRPAGVVSTLDMVRALAWGQPPAPMPVEEGDPPAGGA
jgi:CBS domain-containing protein